MPRTNSEWLYWGRTDPFWGVLSVPGKEARGPAPWTEEEVLEHGRQYFAPVREQWRHYGMGATHCLEIGCGAGRITAQLVACFERVTAIDVSPVVLERAERLVGPDAKRVHFAEVTAPLVPLPDGVCDGVFSCEVFQHFDSIATVRSYIMEAYRVLAPEGTACVSMPVHGLHPATARASRIRNTTLRVARMFGRRQMMIYQWYRAPEVLSLFETAGFRDTELRLFRVEEGGHTAHFFARKP